MEAEARAKLNLRLRVFPAGDDGFHPLETIFCRIDLADRVRVRLWPEPHRVWMHLRGGLDVPDGPENLAFRAAALFGDWAGVQGGIEVDLEKKIPPGSGLGGGSSDAAAVLRTLERVLHLEGGMEALMDMAAELGSDVPFLAADLPLAIGRGRGERLEPGPVLETRPMLIALPDLSISTAKAYAEWDAGLERGAVAVGEPVAISEEQLSSWDQVRELAVNDFEPVILDRYPRLAGIKGALKDSGATIALLSGTGSALFGVYESDSERDEARSRLAGDLRDVNWVSARGPV